MSGSESIPAADLPPKDGAPPPRPVPRQVRQLERQLQQSRDETSRLLSELARTRRDLHDARLMVREVDHRAKNSLQLAASMLFLQSGSIADFETRAEFDRAIERLQNLAAVHAALYQVADGTHVSVRTWLSKIIQSLAVHPHIRIRLECPEISWRVEAATPIGLFVNEAVANALKHGYPAGRGGQIEVTLQAEGEGCWSIEVRDNGEGRIESAGDGLGLRLLRAFARQLGGEMRLASALGGGLSVRARFPGAAAHVQ